MLIKSDKYIVAVDDERWKEVLDSVKHEINVKEGRTTPEVVARGRVLSDAANCMGHRKTLEWMKETRKYIEENMQWEELASKPSFVHLLEVAEIDDCGYRFRYILDDEERRRGITHGPDLNYIARMVSELDDPIVTEEYREWLRSDEYRALERECQALYEEYDDSNRSYEGDETDDYYYD